MMHQVDMTAVETEAPAPGGTSVWWAVVALVIVAALLVTAVIALSGEAPSEPQSPQPTEAPLEPGS